MKQHKKKVKEYLEVAAEIVGELFPDSLDNITSAMKIGVEIAKMLQAEEHRGK